MPKAIFSSRREPLTTGQMADIADTVGMLDFNVQRTDFREGDATVWSATNDASRDLTENRGVWLEWKRLLGPTGVVLGDFPHAAIEALASLPNPPAVYVRVYKIGGGFKRDTEYLRWARLSWRGVIERAIERHAVAP